jgi:hypothetical protein
VAPIGALFLAPFSALFTNPFLYLRDVLERINTHPASRIDKLTPPQWKELFLPKISLPRFPTKAGSRAE